MKIIFQDIDGPLIPLTTPHWLKWDDEAKCFSYDAEAVEYLNKLCEELDAKVVFNSAHNINGLEIMAYQAEHNKIKYLHEEEWITGYPRRFESRLDAIFDWLSRHSEVTDWIVFDDWPVSKTRQVTVMTGIKEGHYLEARELLDDGNGTNR